MKSRILFVLFVMVALTATSIGQMRGGSGGGGMGTGGMSGSGGGHSSMGGMQGSSQAGMGGAGAGGAMLTPAERRQLFHTTAMQDQKYQACTHALSKLQSDLSHMQPRSRGSSNASYAQSSNGAPDGQSPDTSADAPQADDDNGSNLLSDLENLDQVDNDLTASLNTDQQTVVAGKIKDLEKKTKEMQALADQLKSESRNVPPSSNEVRERMKKLTKLSKEIAKEQHEIAAALGISS